MPRRCRGICCTILRIQQVQLDELFALVSDIKTGQVSEDDAIERLQRKPRWVWAAVDPVSKLWLAVSVGERTLAMAQQLVHRVVACLGQGLPTFIYDGRTQGLRHRIVDPLWPLGATAAAAETRGRRPNRVGCHSRHYCMHR